MKQPQTKPLIPSHSLTQTQQIRKRKSSKKFWTLFAIMMGVLSAIVTVFQFTTGISTIPSFIQSIVSYPASTQGKDQLLSPKAMLSAYEKIQPVYEDQLNNPSNPATLQEEWDITSRNLDIGAACTFTPDGYRMSLSNGSTSKTIPSYCYGQQPYRDVLIEAAVNRITNGGGAGILFRVQNSNAGGSDHYSFEIEPKGRSFKIGIHHNENYMSLLNDNSGHFPSSIKSEDTHTLQVITKGKNFFFYIDKVYVAKATDTSYTEGSIGFVCYNPPDGKSKNGEALFSNVSVRDLSNF